MSYNYQNFATLGVNLNRQAYGSLDISEVFNTRADLNYYITKGTSKEGVTQYWLDSVPYPYAGQIVALVEGLEVTFFGLKEKEDGTFETITLGDKVFGDDASIVKGENNTFTIYGFADATEGAQPNLAVDEETGKKYIKWVVPSTLGTLSTKNEVSETELTTELKNKIDAKANSEDVYTKTAADAAIAKAVADAAHLKREIVTKLPAAESVSTSTIYMILKTDGDGDNVYDEYMWINNKWEKLGDTAVDLTDYLTKDGNGSDLMVDYEALDKDGYNTGIMSGDSLTNYISILAYIYENLKPVAFSGNESDLNYDKGRILTHSASVAAVSNVIELPVVGSATIEILSISLCDSVTFEQIIGDVIFNESLKNVTVEFSEAPQNAITARIVYRLSPVTD